MLGEIHYTLFVSSSLIHKSIFRSYVFISSPSFSARAILVIYTPWKEEFTVNDEDALRIFNNKYENNQLPKKVILQIRRAREQYIRKSIFREPVSEAQVFDYNDFTKKSIDGAEENDEAICVGGTLPVTPDEDTDIGLDGLDNINYGQNYKWWKPSYQLSSENSKEVDTWLTNVVATHSNDESPDQLILPLKHNGATYEIDHCQDDQKDILAYIMQRIQTWFNDPEASPQPLRMTICGVAGSGKSTLTNTLVTAVQRMFSSTSSARVMAPTGEAAFNAGGTTCHHSLGIGVQKTIDSPIGTKKLKELISNLHNLVCLIVDERSLISSSLLARMEYNVRHAAYAGKNINQSWGGIPIIIIIGDDYQLPSIEKGAISIFDIKEKFTAEENIGNNLFLELTTTTMKLQESKRQLGNEITFRRILSAQRSEPGKVSHAKLI